MQSLSHWLQQDWIHSLVWTLVHSLWQFALISFGCGLLLYLARNCSARYRYWIAFLSLALGLSLNAITFFQYQLASKTIVIHIEPGQLYAAVSHSNTSAMLISFINRHCDLLILFWLCGLLFYSVKVVRAYGYGQYLRQQQTRPAPAYWQSLFAQLVQKVGINAEAQLRLSELVTAPCTLGHFKPLVLLPASLILHMTQAQVEVILLHELAHIRRRDYSLGLVQSVAKTLFFFNPFLLWISHQIDREREYACDDIAVAISQNPLLYANTLKEFAEMSMHQNTAMGITGKKLLLNRILRLFNKNQQTKPARQQFIASLAIIFSSLTIALCVNAAPELQQEKKISIDVANVSAQELIQQINQKCGTEESVSVTDKLTLVLEDISCTDAIKLVQDFAAGGATKASTGE